MCDPPSSASAFRLIRPAKGRVTLDLLRTRRQLRRVTDGPPGPTTEPHPPDVPLTLVAGAAVAVATVLFGFWAERIDIGVGLILTEICIFFGVSWAVLRVAGISPGRYVGLPLGSAWPLLFGLALGVANFFALVVPIQSLVQSAIDAAVHSNAPARLRELLTQWRDTFASDRLLRGRSRLEMSLIIGGVSLAAPFCEEFFFRGVIQRGLTRRRLMPGLATTALVFAAFHVDPVNFLALAELGLLFGLLYARSGTLWTSVGAHAANNIVSVFIFFASEPSAPDELPEPRTVLTLGAMGGLALLGLLWAARRYPRLLSGQARPSTGTDSASP
jgi:uncharacterized protein